MHASNEALIFTKRHLSATTNEESAFLRLTHLMDGTYGFGVPAMEQVMTPLAPELIHAGVRIKRILEVRLPQNFQQDLDQMTVNLTDLRVQFQNEILQQDPQNPLLWHIDQFADMVLLRLNWMWMILESARTVLQETPLLQDNNLVNGFTQDGKLNLGRHLEILDELCLPPAEGANEAPQ